MKYYTSVHRSNLLVGEQAIINQSAIGELPNVIAREAIPDVQREFEAHALNNRWGTNNYCLVEFRRNPENQIHPDITRVMVLYHGSPPRVFEVADGDSNHSVTEVGTTNLNVFAGETLERGLEILPLSIVEINYIHESRGQIAGYNPVIFS